MIYAFNQGCFFSIITFFQEVEIEDAVNNTNINEEFYMLDSEVNMFSGKEPEAGTYKIINQGNSNPDYAYVTEEFVKIKCNFKSNPLDRLNMFKYNFCFII